MLQMAGWFDVCPGPFPPDLKPLSPHLSFSSSCSCGLLHPLNAMEEEATAALARVWVWGADLDGVVSKTKKHVRQRRPVKRGRPGPALLTSSFAADSQSPLGNETLAIVKQDTEITFLEILYKYPLRP